MSRRLRHQWVGSVGQLRRQSTQRPTAGSFPFRRRLRFEPLEDRRLLANFTISNTNDVVNGTTTSIAALIATPGADGISLREAILAANADNTDAADTIGFSVTGTIHLTAVGHVGEMVINSNLTINGPGASLLTIDAFDPTPLDNNRDGARIFRVDDGNAATFKDVFISGLTLIGGDVNSQGGAIRNASENLAVTACTISGNSSVSGGGLHSNGGHLSVTGSTISGNTVVGSGAGIETAGGSLIVTASTISGNTSPSGGSGGGIFSGGSTATIDSSTISGNSANYGGGISHGGAGILMTITNSTVSGNSARRDGGGVSVVYSDVTIRHGTITGNRADSDGNGTGNGGGVFVLGAASNVTLNHTIVAENFRQASTQSDVFGAVVATSAFNLVGVNTGLTGISNGTIGNQIGTAGSPINPLLGPLKTSGGPTFTHALLAGSPAIDTGNPAFSPPPSNDQRGAPFARIADGDGAGGARVDIGAYERQTLAALFFIVDTLADESDGNFSAGHLSLREAINSAHGSAGDETISFAAALTQGGPASIVLTKGELAISDSVTMGGPGGDLLTIDASGNDPTPAANIGDGSRVFTVNDGSSSSFINVSISGLSLTGGDAPSGGGAIFSSEILTVAECSISGNSTVHAGGGIGVDGGGALTIIASTIRGNAAGRFGFAYSNLFGGGGIASVDVVVTINDTTISGNTAAQGGGIQSLGYVGASLTISNSTISGNTADRAGGIFHYNDNGGGGLTLRHSTIVGNRAGEFYGGGINAFLGTITLDHSIVAGNVRDTATRDDIALGEVVARYSLIGDSTGSGLAEAPVGAPDARGNIIGGPIHGAINPSLGPLADNGGPTMTHALLAGSPAIDAGDPSFNPADPDGEPLTDDAVPYDQRGAPFGRVFDGNSNGVARIDIGGYESQPDGALGDYNRNGAVDAADYVLWRKTLSTSVAPPFSGADGDGDGIVDTDDHGVWRAHFGNVQAPPGAGSGANRASSVVSQELQANAVSERSIPADQVGESVVLMPTETMSASANDGAAAARTASIAALETRFPGHDSRTRSRGRIDRYQVTESSGDDLPLLLAIDCIGRSPRQDSFLNDDSGNGEHRAEDDDIDSEIDDPLAVALAVWRGARSACILPG